MAMTIVVVLLLFQLAVTVSAAGQPHMAESIGRPAYALPDIQQNPKQLTLKEYFTMRMGAENNDGQVHQRHTLLTPAQIVEDFMNWNKANKEITLTDEDSNTPFDSNTISDTQTVPRMKDIEDESLNDQKAPLNFESHSSTKPEANTTPHEPLSSAIYSSSLDAIMMDKNNDMLSSASGLRRRMITSRPSVMGPYSNRWTPVPRNRRFNEGGRRERLPNGLLPNTKDSFEGGGGGLHPRFMNKPKYIPTSSFRQKKRQFPDASVEQFSIRDVRPVAKRPHRHAFRPQSRNNYIDTVFMTSTSFDSLETISDDLPEQNMFKNTRERTRSPEYHWHDRSNDFSEESLGYRPRNEARPQFHGTVKRNPPLTENIFSPIDSNHAYFESPESAEHDYSNKNSRASLRKIHKFSRERKPTYAGSHHSEYEKPSIEFIDFKSTRDKYTNNIFKDDKHFENIFSLDAEPIHNSRNPELHFKSSTETPRQTYHEEILIENDEDSRLFFLSGNNNKKHQASIIDENTHSNYYSEEKNIFKNDNNKYNNGVIEKDHNYKSSYDTTSKEPNVYWQSTTERPRFNNVKSSETNVENDEDPRLYYINKGKQGGRQQLREQFVNANGDGPSNNPFKYDMNIGKSKDATETDRFSNKPLFGNYNINPTTSIKDKRESLASKNPTFKGHRISERYPNSVKSRNDKGNAHSHQSEERSDRPRVRYQSIELKKIKPKAPKEPTQYNQAPRYKAKKPLPMRRVPRFPARVKNSKAKKTTNNNKDIDNLSLHHIAGPPYHDPIPEDVVKSLANKDSKEVIVRTVKPHEDHFEKAVDAYLDKEGFSPFNEDGTSSFPSSESDAEIYYKHKFFSTDSSDEKSKDKKDEILSDLENILEVHTPRSVNEKGSYDDVYARDDGHYLYDAANQFEDSKEEDEETTYININNLVPEEDSEEYSEHYNYDIFEDHFPRGKDLFSNSPEDSYSESRWSLHDPRLKRHETVHDREPRPVLPRPNYVQRRPPPSFYTPSIQRPRTFIEPVRSNPIPDRYIPPSIRSQGPNTRMTRRPNTYNTYSSVFNAPSLRSVRRIPQALGPTSFAFAQGLSNPNRKFANLLKRRRPSG